MKARTPNSLTISEDILYQLAVIANRLVYACKDECNIEPQALLVLLHIKHFGKTYQGDMYLPRLLLTRMLKDKFSYSDGDISKLMVSLHSAGLITRGAVSPKERVEIFGKPGGTQVVTLTSDGTRRIEQFRNAVAGHAERWFAKQSRKTSFAAKKGMALLEALAMQAVRIYDPNFSLETTDETEE